MTEGPRRLFIGIKISKSLQQELDARTSEVKDRLEGDNDPNGIRIIDYGDHRIIGQYIEPGCSATQVTETTRHVCRIVKLMTRGSRIEENDVRIYSKNAL